MSLHRFTHSETREKQIWEDADWKWVVELTGVDSGGAWYGWNWSLRDHHASNPPIAEGFDHSEDRCLAAAELALAKHLASDCGQTARSALGQEATP